MTLVFVFIVAAILLYLIVDGFITGEVWVRGARKGFVNFSQWAHKRSREEEPVSYWMFMGLYAVGIVGIAVILLFK